MQGLRIDTTPLNPIYLEMGAAVQDCQRIELYISFIVTLLIELSGGTLSDQEFKGSMESLGSQTLGRLMEEIKKKVGFTDDAVLALRKSQRSRNFLIHRFYNERSDLLLTQAGREETCRHKRGQRHARRGHARPGQAEGNRPGAVQERVGAEIRKLTQL